MNFEILPHLHQIPNGGPAQWPAYQNPRGGTPKADGIWLADQQLGHIELLRKSAALSPWRWESLGHQTLALCIYIDNLTSSGTVSVNWMIRSGMALAAVVTRGGGTRGWCRVEGGSGQAIRAHSDKWNSWATGFTEHRESLSLVPDISGLWKETRSHRLISST